MSEPDTAPDDPDAPEFYEIRIKGRLEDKCAARFEGLTLTPAGDGETLLTGWVVDQTALHGLLRTVRDLGLPLIAVTRVRPGQARTSEVKRGVEASGSGQWLRKEISP